MQLIASVLLLVLILIIFALIVSFELAEEFGFLICFILLGPSPCSSRRGGRHHIGVWDGGLSKYLAEVKTGAPNLRGFRP